MKTLAGWIVGVFALGLVVGGVFGGTSAGEKSEASVVQNLPAIDCGAGREALFVPTQVDGKTSLSIKCIATPVEARVATPVTARAPVAPAATVPSASTPTSTPRAVGAVEDSVSASGKDARDWKDSAIVIGGAAGAGAGIGALAKGGKGAAVGAAIGGVAGTVYELARGRK